MQNWYINVIHKLPENVKNDSSSRLIKGEKKMRCNIYPIIKALDGFHLFVLAILIVIFKIRKFYDFIYVFYEELLREFQQYI
jgi:hypothetical protein